MLSDCVEGGHEASCSPSDWHLVVALGVLPDVCAVESEVSAVLSFAVTPGPRQTCCKKCVLKTKKVS